MNAQDASKLFAEKLAGFLRNSRKVYSSSDKHTAVRVDKQGKLTHRKYGPVVQMNKDGIAVVCCNSMGSLGSELAKSAILVMAECILGKDLYFQPVSARPRDGDWTNVAFDNIEFVDLGSGYNTDCIDIDFTGVKSSGALWFANVVSSGGSAQGVAQQDV